MTNWIIFSTFLIVGVIDLVVGFVFVRTPDAPVGAPPPQAGEPSPASRRLVGRTMMFSAFLLWALAGVFASGLLGPDFALPIFAQSVE